MRLAPTLTLAGLLLTAACSPIDDVVVPATESGTTAHRQSTAPDALTHSVMQFTMQSITGQPINLGQYRGRKLLIVNVASHCSYTPQYAQLEQLWQQYGDKVVVLGFPCNNFGRQEPGNDSTILNFCTSTYNVTFPMFHKINTIGAQTDPLYTFLRTPALNGTSISNPPSWNFCKYLVNENGFLMAFYPSNVSPMSPQILHAIRQ